MPSNAIDVQDISNVLDSVFTGAQALLVIPPFFNIDSISLGPYILKEICKKNGQAIDILHLELLLARVIGPDRYFHIQKSKYLYLLGERLFARSAHGLPPMGKNAEDFREIEEVNGYSGNSAAFIIEQEKPYSIEEYFAIEQLCFDLIKVVSKLIATKAYRLLGVSIGFCNQVNASIAFLNHVKGLSPETTTLVGGSFCTGNKALSLLDLCPNIDHLFSGESDYTLPQFIDQFYSDNPPVEKHIKGTKMVHMNDVPMADYSLYHQNTIKILGEQFWRESIKGLWYESNRGCWWADITRCSFCGIPEANFRQRDIDMLWQELKQLHETFPEKVIMFTDLIMDKNFPQKFLQETQEAKSLPRMGFQIKVGKTVQEVDLLRRSNIKVVIAGIESFSTKMLKKMRKGTTGRDNIYFLRNAKSMKVEPQYALLFGHPQDTLEEFQFLIRLIPMIPHLQPVMYFDGVHFLRDSPLFYESQNLGIKELKPLKAYSEIYPPQADLNQFANFHTAKFQSVAYENKELMQEINDLVVQWRANHKASYLYMSMLMEGTYFLLDQRIWEGNRFAAYPMELEQAEGIMTLARTGSNPWHSWALEKKVGIELDGWYIPLATAEPDLLLALDQSQKRKRSSVMNKNLHHQSLNPRT